MKGYETICILHPDLGEEEVQNTIDQYTRIISDNGGEVHKSENWGLKKLAYKVKGNVKGAFIYLLFGGEPETVSELERNLRIADQNIRYMTIKVDSLEDAAKVKVQLLDDPTLSIQEGRDGKF